MAVGLTVSTAGASGEQTTAVLTSPLTGSSTTFTWSYEFDANGGHDLSNIAISFCSTDILPHVVSASPSGEAFASGDVPGGHTGFGPGVKFATTAVSGTLTVVFDQPYTAGGTINVQSHSGDGQDGDLVTVAGGPGTCNPTTTTAAPATTTTVPATTTTVPATTTTLAAVTTTTAPPVTTTTAPATTTTAPAVTTTAVQQVTTTTVPAVTTTAAPATTTTTVRATTTAPPPPATTTTVAVAGNRLAATTTTMPATTSTSIPTSVLGARFSADDAAPNLAKTGFTGGPLLVTGTVLVLLGLALLVGDRLQPARS